MKKALIFVSVAALALVSCAKVTDQYVGAPESHEIAFQALTTPATRAAVDGADFPTTSTMNVAAFDVTNHREFFGSTVFSYDSAESSSRSTNTIWTANPAKYWPLSATYINFMAYAELQASETPTLTWPTAASPAADAKATWALVMTDNSSAQKDLMYAMGQGEVATTGTNGLTFPADVPMQFKHAQAWISFYANTDANSGGLITLNSITLTGAKYNGTYTINYANCYNNASQDITGTWSELGVAKPVAVPNWTSATIAYASSGNGAEVGDGLMIVPDDNPATDDFTSFTIAYTLDGKDYTYTYIPAAKNVDQAKHYIYNIVFKLHEIKIDATVLDWVDQTPTTVEVI